ncbi:MAG: hypothetical protein ACFFCE_01610 [Promethearchaeota archaeon]
MKYKAKSALILLLVSISFSSFSILGKSFYCEVYNFETDKTKYFIDGNIIINASWLMDYNPAIEIAFIQIQIFNGSDFKLWNSSEYDNVGVIEKNWTLDIQSLDIDFNNSTNILYVKMYFFYFHFDTTNTVSTYLDLFEIKIYKKDITHEIINIENDIMYGQCLNYSIRVYENITMEYITSKEIGFKVYSDSNLIFQNTYITDENGQIDIFLNSTDSLNIGLNILDFELESDTVYNDYQFSSSVNVRRIPIIIEVLECQNIYETNTDINISLFFYYGNFTPIKNEYFNIYLNYKANNSLIYQNTCLIDDNGIATIEIPVTFLENNQNFTLLSKFQGTDILDNNSIVVEFKYRDPNMQISISDRDVLKKMITPLIIMIVIGVVVGVLFLNRNAIRDKTNVKKLMELTIKH